MNHTRSVLSVGVVTLFATAMAAQVPTWTPLSANSPGPRYGASLCPDGGNALLLFGGHDGTSLRNDTWRYDLATGAWTAIATPNAPSPRRWHRTVYHAASGSVMLHGGDVATGPSNETWVFAGNNWLQLAAGPSARSTHAMAYDSARQRTVLFGGFNLSDTWEWNGTSWTQRFPTVSPGVRTFAGMAYDSRRQRIVLAGGTVATGVNYASSVWEYDGTSWVPSPFSLPTPVSGIQLTYDRSRGRIVGFGGLVNPGGQVVATNTTLEWDGVSPWMTRLPPQGAPAARYGSNLVYLSDGGTWLFGGSGFGPVYGDLRRYAIGASATYTSVGPGCGAPALTAEVDELPWLGEAFVRGANFSGINLVVHMLGFTQPNLDLTSLGMPGCQLGSSAELMNIVLTQSGRQQFTLSIPNDPALHLVTLFEQFSMFVPAVNPFGAVLSPTQQIRCGAK